jgi:hypothetical protein
MIKTKHRYIVFSAATLFTTAIIGAVHFSFSSTPVIAARLDGCDPSATENQGITGAVWKAKCLNAGVNSVWQKECDTMTLKDAKKSSSQNGCWKLMSQAEYAKQK